MLYTINSTYKKLGFFNTSIQGNAGIDSVLSVKNNLTIIDRLKFKSSICHKMTLLVSLQPLVDSSNPPHRPVIPFAQMTSVINAEVTLREHEHTGHSYPPEKGFLNTIKGLLSLLVICLTLLFRYSIGF